MLTPVYGVYYFLNSLLLAKPSITRENEVLNPQGVGTWRLMFQKYGTVRVVKVTKTFFNPV